MTRYLRVLVGTWVCGAMLSATFASAQDATRKLKAVSPEEVLVAVEALYEEDVAWRNVQWDTCLLEGLKKSTAQHKPLMLWIFIDRPVDDERC